MCGLVGLIAPALSPTEREARALSMRARLRHRGPDDAGLFLDADGGAALAHARLAIIDLSAAGHQPLVSPDGRHVIVFNGEIYNYKTLRQSLSSRGIEFRTQTDTEVILALYRQRGAECVRHLSGMFAFAVWDTQERTLFLARDPFGIKPLYVWESQGQIAFASELRAVLAAALASRQLDAAALFDFLQTGSVSEPRTLVQGVRQLPAGQTLLWRDGQSSSQRYWQPQFPASGPPPADPVAVTRAALLESLDRHFVSDVPVGLFLSGGIDSTALVALAASSGRTNLQTFCISFGEREYNEGDLAARTAAHFGTRHVDWRLTAEEGATLIDGYLAAMDQPSNDGFNSYCVSRLAHDRGLKVVLSGLGGDELFAGYPSFRQIPRLAAWHRGVRWFPGRRRVGDWLATHGRSPRLRRLGEFVASPGTLSDAWQAQRGFFTRGEAARHTQWLSGDLPTASPDSVESDRPEFPTVADEVSYLELTRYMRNQLLRDSDVMSMAWGLELRVPFVDRELFDALAVIPAQDRLAAGKQLLIRSVPEIPDWIVRQPKRGFRFPFQQWAEQAWGPVFAEINSSSPIPCRTWYRTWSLFVLRHFLETNHIAAGEVAGQSAAP
jgi:asparagine synthase (glutamine-hydrolysing)